MTVVPRSRPWLAGHRRWGGAFLLAISGIGFVLCGCRDDKPSSSQVDAGPTDAGTDSATVDTATPDVADDATSADTNEDTAAVTCEGDGLCAPACGGDVIGPSTCVEGRWVCDDPGWVLVDDCPPGSCFGLPQPGEVCRDGWQCADDTDAFWQGCYIDACFPDADYCGSFERDTRFGCTCICSPETTVVSCASCEPEATSNLPGVALILDTTPCILTLAEVAEGVTLAWTLDIDTAHSGVVPENLNTENCGPTERPESGLVVFASIRGVNDTYCPWCDQGLCDPGRTLGPWELSEGEFAGALEWTGRNWRGPSDTGNPLGEPFPNGEYTFRVEAHGTYVDDNGVGVEFSVVATRPIVLVR